MLASLNQPLVSIIIPTYNYGYLLSETVDSLLKQTYQNWEAIIIDDGSTDDTEVEVKKFLSDCRIKYIYQINKGLSEARNTGLLAISGKYVSFLDADDLISKDKISIQVRYMEDNDSSIISYTKAEYFKNNAFGVFYNTLELSDTEAIIPLQDKEGSHDFLNKLIQSNFSPVNTPLIRASFIKEKLISFKPSLKALEDWDFWLQCAFAGANFRYIDDSKALAYIRVHEKSMSADRSYMYDWELKLRQVISIYIKKSVFINEEELAKINQKATDVLYRMNIRKNGLFNLKYLKKLIPEIGFLRALKLTVKEINAIRRNK